MDKNLQSAFVILQERYGAHCLAATAIGITPDHYRKMRNGRANIPQRTADYIILRAFEPESGLPPTVTPAADTAPTARPWGCRS